MATGFYDAEGIWTYGEDDPASPFSNTLNLLSESTSDAIAADRGRIRSLELQWHVAHNTTVFAPADGVTLVSARAAFLPGVMACVHLRLGTVNLGTGDQNVHLGNIRSEIAPEMYFAPIEGWHSSGAASGLVAPEAAVTVRWSSDASSGALVLSGSWPL